MFLVGVKGGRGVRLTTLLPSVKRLSRENVGASTSHNPIGLHGLLQGLLYFSRIAAVMKSGYSNDIILFRPSEAE
jgi:hypothetical protein